MLHFGMEDVDAEKREQVRTYSERLCLFSLFMAGYGWLVYYGI